ncbi:hypothetical protein D3C73_1338290 [compost metagenome]
MDVSTLQLHQRVEHRAVDRIAGQQQIDLDRIQRVEQKMRADLRRQRPKLKPSPLFLLALHPVKQLVDILQHLVEDERENGHFILALHRNPHIPVAADILLDAGAQ